MFNVSAVSGGYAVASGQTLTGTGSILGSTTIASGAFLTPGQGGPGVITFNNDLTLGGTVSLAINGTTVGSQYSNVAVGGNLGYGGALSLSFGALSAAGNSYTLFSVTGTKSGDFSSVVLTGSHNASLVGTSSVWTADADGLSFTFNDSTGVLDVVTAVPEPSTLAMISGLTALGCAAYVRRRRRQA